MRRWLAAAAALVAPALCGAQEIVTVQPRPGVTQSFFVANMGGVKAEAVALVYSGGYGTIRLRMENGEPKFQQGNFLVRTRRDFIRNGIQPVLVDVPSDEATGVSDDYRFGERQVTDARAVLSDVKKRFPGLPVFVLTTSRSTLSGANLGRSLGPDEIAGVVLSSSMIAPGRKWQALGGFDFKAVKTRLLFVHHRSDGCPACPYPALARAAEGFPLISVDGGKPPESGPCDPFAAHGYFGKEAETVDAIAAWMLGKPFETEIK